MRTPQHHLKNALGTSGIAVLSGHDKQILTDSGTENFILTCLMNKKFRKWKIADSCLERTEKAIHLAVSVNRPVHVVFFQGGYKLWRLPGTPEADWAEFFNVAYLLDYIAPIAAAYPPGVTISYYLHTFLMEQHDNLTTEEIEAYVTSFQMVINAFLKHTPLNISLRIWKDADLYGRTEYFETLEGGFAEAERQFDAMTRSERERYMEMSRLNMKWNGKTDYSSLNEPEKADILRKSAIWEKVATNCLTRTFQTAKGEDKILLFTKNSPIFIGIGSTKTSTVKYWTGFGVLEKNGDTYQERVLSPKQYEYARSLPHDVAPIDILPLRNFHEIWVYPEPFNFVHKQ